MSATWTLVGTMLGVSIERRLAMGDTLMRVVSPIDSPALDAALRERLTWGKPAFSDAPTRSLGSR